MAKKPLTLSAWQKRALLVEKTKKATTLARQHPELAKQVAELLPPSPKKRLHTIAATRAHVGRLKNKLETAALDAETANTTRASLGVATTQLKRLIDKSARHRALKKSTTVGTVALNAHEQKLRLRSVEHQYKAIEAQIGMAKNQFNKSSGDAARRKKSSTKLTLLHTTLAGLKYRRGLILRGRGVRLHPVAEPHQMGHKLIPLGVPALFRSPDRGEAALAIRLVAANRPRREGEHEDRYRGTLRAYVKRALVRKINKPHLANHLAVTEAVQETLAEDAPAIEEAASLGAVPSDDLGNLVDAALQDASEEMEEAIIDFDPEADPTVKMGVIRENLHAVAQGVIQQAGEEEAALLAEGDTPLDLIVPPDESSAAPTAPTKTTPFYMRKDFLIPAAIAAAALLVLRR
jgi:hypothetical protein